MVSLTIHMQASSSAVSSPMRRPASPVIPTRSRQGQLAERVPQLQPAGRLASLPPVPPSAPATAPSAPDPDPRRLAGVASGRAWAGEFTCPVCKCTYGDPLYHGPAGHAPAEMCYDCWASEWGEMVQMVSRGGNWRPIDSALFLICQGFTHKEAADLAGICRKALHAWIRQARQQPHMAPEWLVQAARQREQGRR